MPQKDPEARRAYQKKYYQAHREERCTAEQVRYATNREAILVKVLTYQAAHQEERRTKARLHYAANRTEINAHRRVATANLTPEQQATIRAYRKHYGQTHRTEIRANKRQYERNNPHIIRNNYHKRRARKRNAPRTDLTHTQWVAIQEAQEHCCAYCGKRCKGHLTQDHITPLSQGGSHTLHNVIGACRECNSKKHTGPPLTPVQPLLLTVAPAKKKKAS